MTAKRRGHVLLLEEGSDDPAGRAEHAQRANRQALHDAPLITRLDASAKRGNELAQRIPRRCCCRGGRSLARLGRLILYGQRWKQRKALEERPQQGPVAGSPSERRADESNLKRGRERAHAFFHLGAVPSHRTHPIRLEVGIPGVNVPQLGDSDEEHERSRRGTPAIESAGTIPCVSHAPRKRPRELVRALLRAEQRAQAKAPGDVCDDVLAAPLLAAQPAPHVGELRAVVRAVAEQRHREVRQAANQHAWACAGVAHAARLGELGTQRELHRRGMVLRVPLEREREPEHVVPATSAHHFLHQQPGSTARGVEYWRKCVACGLEVGVGAQVHTSRAQRVAPLLKQRERNIRLACSGADTKGVEDERRRWFGERG